MEDVTLLFTLGGHSFKLISFPHPFRVAGKGKDPSKIGGIGHYVRKGPQGTIC